MPVFTARLAIAGAFAAVVAVFVPGSVVDRLVAVNSVVLVAALVDFLVAPRPHSISVSRSIPSAVVLGSVAELSWAVSTRSRRRAVVSIADELARSLGAGTRRFSAVVPASGTVVITTAMEPTRRGRFEISELTIRVRGPLGLAARQTRRGQTDIIRVYPRFRSRREAELRIDRARILDVGIRSVKGRGGGTNFDQLREYTLDDEYRRIDWSATARAGRPIVRDYRAERNQTVVVLYDNGRVMAGQVGGVPRAEYAMDAALLLATVATRVGDKCGLIAFDRSVRVSVAPALARRQASAITEALYDLEPTLLDSDYRGAFAAVAARQTRRSLIVVLTDLVDQAVGDSLVPALPVLRSRHLVLVGAIQDPQLVSWSDEEPADVDGVYRQAAAMRTLQARQRAAAQLRSAGAVVVDVTPGALASTLGDAYLDAKAAGRL